MANVTTYDMRGKNDEFYDHVVSVNRKKGTDTFTLMVTHFSYMTKSGSPSEVESSLEIQAYKCPHTKVHYFKIVNRQVIRTAKIMTETMLFDYITDVQKALDTVRGLQAVPLSVMSY